MTIVAGSVNINAKFIRQLEENAERTNSDEGSSPVLSQERKHYNGFSGKLNTLRFASSRGN